MNAAIGTLLGVTLVVLTGIAVFGVVVIRRFAHVDTTGDSGEGGRHG